MNEPKRLALESENDLERILLRAGRLGAPAGAKERALLAVSATLAASSLTAGAASASPAGVAAKAGLVAALKWLGLISLTGVGAVASAVVVHYAHEGTPRSNVAATLAPQVAAGETRPPATQTATTELATLEPPSPATRYAPTVPVVTGRSSPKAAESGAWGGSTLPAELATLERARAAIGVGELTRALSILDGYSARYPHGAMAPEAAVLRIEALVKMGNRPAATRFANGFLATQPHSPYAGRIQSLLAAPNQ